MDPERSLAGGKSCTLNVPWRAGGKRCTLNVMNEQHPEEFSPTGDAVCWLERVCQDCGALIEEELPATCWRCGNRVMAV
jgi:hypothetical protein